MKLYVYSSRTFVVLAMSLVSLMTSQTAWSAAPAPIALVPQSAAPASIPAPIKSYREWKISMISEADARLKVTKEMILIKTRNAASKDPNLASSNLTEAGVSNNLKTMQNKYDKESLQLSMAHDLTISDYFVGYLTKQKEVDKAIREVSSRLTAEEVAELMSAYANNFFSSRPSEAKAAPTANSTGSLNP